MTNPSSASPPSSSAPRSDRIVEQTLPGGGTLLAELMPEFHTATLMIRVDGGMCSEPEDQLGLAYVVEQGLDKGAAGMSARQLADAFDAIGSRYAIYTGRQSWLLVASMLPEYMPRAAELLGRMIAEPHFPDEAIETAVSLCKQELSSLEDSPRGLLRRQMVKQAYGSVLGRHYLGTQETLDAIDGRGVREHWQTVCGRDRVTVAAAGRFELEPLRDALLTGLSQAPAQAEAPVDPEPGFGAATSHVQKDLEQTQIGISFPGTTFGSDDFAAERMLLGVLSGGMSSRLFTEVREKQGLVYWVGAWHEQSRGLGMIHLGAATRPDRCRRTYDTLLAEIARLEDDLTQEELDRARVGLIADSTTSGASVQQRANELLVDHFHLGRTVDAEQKLDDLRAVTTTDITEYLKRYSRDELSIVTVGREPLEETE